MKGAAISSSEQLHQLAIVLCLTFFIFTLQYFQKQTTQSFFCRGYKKRSVFSSSLCVLAA